MQGPTRPTDNFKEILLSSARSTGFWSAIAAIVGAVAAAAGGILYLSIDQLDDFSISVLIVGLLLLFVALVLSPRAVAIFVVGRQGRYGTNVVVMTVAFFAILVLVNFLLDRNATRFDVTATRVFSLAPQTTQVLENIDTVVRANAFFVPDRRIAARQQAEDLLNEFVRRSRKLDYRFVDPQLNRTLALQYGVTEYPTIVFEDVERGTQQTVECLSPASLPTCVNFTEQSFVTGILVVTGERQKRVYFLIGHKESATTLDQATGQTEDEGFDFALQGMARDNYVLRALNLKQSGSVPEDAAVLVIAGPKQDLDDPEREAISEYLKSGGRVVALFDPGTPQSFVDLISQWGIKLGQHRVADALSNVAGEMLTPLAQRASNQYTSSNATGIGIADQIDVTFFPDMTSVESIVPLEDIPPYIRFIPLAVTTPASWLETDAEDVSYNPDIDDLGPFYIAVAVTASGTIDEAERHPVAKLVVFGDSDFARNRFFYSSDNADLLLNSVNWLAEDFDLISIRPKVLPFRELVVNSRERDFIKWSSWIVPPTVMIILGLIVWWRRR